MPNQPPFIRIRLTNKKVPQKVWYIFNRGLQWACMLDDGNPSGLANVTHDPIMFMFALEDALLQGAGDGTDGKRALTAAVIYCPEFKCNLVTDTSKPYRRLESDAEPEAEAPAPKGGRKPKAAPAPEFSLASAGIDLDSLAVSAGK